VLFSDPSGLKKQDPSLKRGEFLDQPKGGYLEMYMSGGNFYNKLKNGEGLGGGVPGGSGAMGGYGYGTLYSSSMYLGVDPIVAAQGGEWKSFSFYTYDTVRSGSTAFYNGDDFGDWGNLQEQNLIATKHSFSYWVPYDGGGYDMSGGNSFDGSSYFQTLGLMYSTAGEYGSRKFKSGSYIQNSGNKGNFLDRPFKRLSQNAKSNYRFYKGLKGLSTAGNIVAAGAIAYDVFDDGNIKASTVVNAALLTVSLAFPPTAIFVLGYGVADYFFDISGTIDNNFGEIKTGLYD
jgi:hypothetical protein